MPPDQLHNPFDSRPPADPSTADFLGALVDEQTAEAFRKAMGEEVRPSTTEDSTTEPTPEVFERALVAQDKLRETQEKKDREQLPADYLAWAREFNLGGFDPQKWIDETFIFNPDGTVETVGNLYVMNKGLTYLPKGLTCVNGDIRLDDNDLTSLDDLRGKKIGGDLWLRNTPATTIPEGIDLGGEVYVKKFQTALASDARAKGYTVILEDG